jgi:uncharacterized protein YbcI
LLGCEPGYKRLEQSVEKLNERRGQMKATRINIIKRSFEKNGRSKVKNVNGKSVPVQTDISLNQPEKVGEVDHHRASAGAADEAGAS